jgi:hypothetical protein
MGVGALAACSSRSGRLPTPPITALEATLTVGLGAAYYARCPMAEQRWPAAGWLLGAAVQPVYAGPGITRAEIEAAIAAIEVDSTPPPRGTNPATAPSE